MIISMYDYKLCTYADKLSIYDYKLCMSYYKLCMYDYKLRMNVCVVITLLMCASKHKSECMYVRMIISIESTL